MLLGQMGSPLGQRLDPFLIFYTRTNSKWNKDLNTNEIIKALEEAMEELKNNNLGLVKAFRIMTSNPEAIKKEPRYTST